MGLRPAGDNGTFFQNLPYGPAGFDSLRSTLFAGGAPLVQKTEWVPIAPTATNGVSGGANLDGVPTVFAGRWGDTATALDPAVFKGKVAVFIASAQAAGLSGRGGQRVLRCDSVPNKFGADAAARVEAQVRADSAAGRGRGAGRG